MTDSFAQSASNRGCSRIGILGASLATGNLGVSALASGTISAALHARPGGKVYLLDYARESGVYQVRTAGGVADVELINIRFSKRVFLQNNIARLLVVAWLSGFLPAKWKIAWRKRYPSLDAIQSSEAMGSVAGGDSFSDIYGLSRFIYVALPQILTLVMGRPLVLLPQTLGPFRSFLARMVAKWILRRASLVCSRDAVGLEEANALFKRTDGRFRFAYDMGFALEPAAAQADLLERLPNKRRNEVLVGMNVSGLLLMGGYNERNMFNLRCEYRRVVEGVVETLMHDTNVRILLVPHVFSKDSESDVDACRAIHETMKARFGDRISRLEGVFDPHEIKFIIGRCDFFIGARMHACIAAVSQAVPTASLAYSRKFAGVMDSIGMSESVVDLTAMPVDCVLERVRALFAGRAVARQALSAKVDAIKKSALEIFTSLSLDRTQFEGAA